MFQASASRLQNMKQEVDSLKRELNKRDTALTKLEKDCVSFGVVLLAITCSSVCLRPTLLIKVSMITNNELASCESFRNELEYEQIIKYNSFF